MKNTECSLLDKVSLNGQLIKFHDYTIVKKYGDSQIKVVSCNTLITGSKKHQKEKCKEIHEYTTKLANNISRAKIKVQEYSLCNEWDYFITLTLDKKKYDRENLARFIKDLTQFIRNNIRRKYNTEFSYLLIPELHKDGKSWHMHGLIKGLPADALTKNKNGYLHWEGYAKKFGYNSLGKIKDKQKVSSYITKYITKSMNDLKDKLNAKLYYCSRGLEKATLIARGYYIADEPITYDFKNEYVRIKTFQYSKELDEYFKNSIKKPPHDLS